MRLPSERLDQLCLLADGRGELATDVVRDLVLRFLDEQDPEGDLMSVPAKVCSDGAQLAEIIQLPRMNGLMDGPNN